MARNATAALPSIDARSREPGEGAREPLGGAITARDGARAEIVERDGEERLQVRSPQGAVIFEYDPTTGKSTLSVPSGDLALCVPGGNIDLVAGKDIRCFAAGEVAIAGASGASVGARAPGAAPAGLRVDPGHVKLHGEGLSVAAARADLRIAEGRYLGSSLSATIDKAQLAFDRLETVAHRVIARARDLYQSVQDLHDMRSGRMRVLVEEALDMKGGSTTIQADGDVRIDGEKINLG